MSEARDAARRRSAERRRYERLVGNHHEFTAITPADEHEALENAREFRCTEVRRVLALLPAKQREMARRRWIDGERPKTIADAMGMQANSVYSRLWELGEKAEGAVERTDRRGVTATIAGV